MSFFWIYYTEKYKIYILSTSEALFEHTVIKNEEIKIQHNEKVVSHAKTFINGIHTYACFRRYK